MRRSLALLTTAIVTAAASAGSARADAGWVYPVGPPHGPVTVVNGYDPPAEPWLAGHRGVDLAAPAGTQVRAAGTGRVSYAGMLAGRGVVAIDHGTVRTTYEPVRPSVEPGDQVSTGEPLGALARRGSHCAPETCLHWGLREGEQYRDPMNLVDSSAVRLLPLGERTISGDAPPVPDPQAALDWPVAEPRVTSPFGMRTHPITGVYKLHDGTDFATACGTPIRASAAGRVSDAGSRGAYGLQVTLEHGVVGDTAMTTSYSHLSRLAVSPGQSVRSGSTIGFAGTTGSSTGCHLHFMLYADGGVVDPMPRLPGGNTRH